MRTTVLCMIVATMVCSSCVRRTTDLKEIPSGKVLSVTYPIKVADSDENTTVVVSRFVTVVVKGIVVLSSGEWWIYINHVDRYVRFTEKGNRKNPPDVIYPLLMVKKLGNQR